MDQASTTKLLEYKPLPKPPDCQYVRDAKQRQEIIEMFNDGLSMGIIADKLGTSRGAIAGVISRQRKRGVLVRRLQPQFRKPPNHTGTKPTEPRIAEPRWFKPPPVIPVKKKRVRLRMIDDETEVTLQELQPHQCKYPLGDPKQPDFRFCGCRRLASSPYCEKHTVICLDPRYYKYGSR